MIVQLARQVPALFFLRVDELLRQLAHLTFRFFRALFEDAQPDDDDQRHDEAEEHGLPEQPLQVVAERRVAPVDLRALRLEVRVVQLLDLLRDRQHRFAPRHHFPPQERGAPRRIFSAGVQSNSGIERLPVVVQLGLQAGDPIVAADQRLELVERGHVGAPEFGELLAVLGRALARDVQQVVAHEDAREVDVRPEPPEVGRRRC